MKYELAAIDLQDLVARILLDLLDLVVDREYCDFFNGPLGHQFGRRGPLDATPKVFLDGPWMVRGWIALARERIDSLNVGEGDLNGLAGSEGCRSPLSSRIAEKTSTDGNGVDYP